MDEPQQPRSASWLHRDGPWLVALLILVASLRGWLLVNTEVTARDSIGFIRYSLLFDRALASDVDASKKPPETYTWSTILKNNHQHPGYPVTLWLVSKPLRAMFGTTPDVMRLSAQLVSLTASLLLAFVMFQLGKHLWDRHVGFFAALLFQFLPTPGHHLSDGISDGLCLLMTMSALYTLIRAWESGSLPRYLLGGVFIGLGYLTRPEGLMVLPAAWLFLLTMQFVKSHKKPWPQTGAAFAALTLGWAIAGSPYFAATGSLSNKPSFSQFLDEAVAYRTDVEDGPLFASLFGATFTPGATTAAQVRLTLRALFMEVVQSLNYIGSVPALWALLFCRKTLTRNAGFYLLAIYFAIQVAILISLGMTKSYVSDRHVMPLVAMSCYLCVVGITHMCMPWSWWIARGRSSAEGFVFPLSVQCAGAFFVVVVIGLCSPKTTSRLHGNRAGNHQAGLWLAKHAKPEDMISDDHNWSHFYAGHLFVEGREPIVPANVQPNHYHVMTRSKEDSVREKRETQEESLKQTNAKIVYHWPENADQAKARIVIYAMPRDFAANPWKRADGPSVFQPVSREK